MPHNCGSCKHFKPGEKVKCILPNGKMELEDEDEFWGLRRGACTADPSIRPMPYAWFYTNSGFLNTIGTTKRSGKTCARWDDGGRDLVMVELEQQAAAALERAASDAKVTTSSLLFQLLLERERREAIAKRRQGRVKAEKRQGDEVSNSSKG